MRRLFFIATFLPLLFLATPAVSVAAALININTADAVSLETLPGIGTTKANAIVSYRAKNGLFAATADIQKVSGIGASTYAEISSLITVRGVTQVPETSASTSTASSSNATPFVPQGAWIDVEEDVTATLYVPYTFRAQVRSKTNLPIDDTDIHWSFGDGSTGTGTMPQKTFEYAGTYVVTATVMRDGEKIQGTVMVHVKSSSVRIDSVSSEGIMIANDSDAVLDLSYWRMTVDEGLFKVPEGTEVAPNAKVLFPWSILNVPISFKVRLAYPSGKIAAQYESSPSQEVRVSMQPPAEKQGSYTVQVPTVVAVTSQSTTVHEATGVLAPTAATLMAAVGAPLSPQVPVENSPQKNGISAIVASPWSLGFLGVLAVSVGAFILL